MNNMEALKGAIYNMVEREFIVSQLARNKEFALTEDLQEVANIKAACILLEEMGKINITNNNGEVMLSLTIEEHATKH